MYRYADGAVQVSFYKAAAPVGEGVWETAVQPCGCATARVEVISLEEARRIVAEHGLPIPEGK